MPIGEGTAPRNNFYFRKEIIMNFIVSEIESILGYHFRNPDLLYQAFVRSSFAREHGGTEDNEILEFIGDSVLGTVVVKKLISRYGELRAAIPEEALREQLREKFPDSEGFTTPFYSPSPEGDLSELKISLVAGKTLARALAQTGLQDYLRMGKGDVAEGTEQVASVQEDLLEAILGAVTLDSDWNLDAVAAVVDRLLDPDRILEQGEDEPDYVQMLEDLYGQGKLKNRAEYEISEAEGEYPYRCNLNMVVFYCEYIFSGKGKTEQGAKRLTARFAWKAIMEAEKERARFFDALGPLEEIDWSRSINHLQELWQKKLIPEPQYRFVEASKDPETGNPQWHCFCTIEDYGTGDGWGSANRKEAKKEAATHILANLLYETFPKHSDLNRGTKQNLSKTKKEEKGEISYERN